MDKTKDNMTDVVNIANTNTNNDNSRNDVQTGDVVNSDGEVVTLGQ